MLVIAGPPASGKSTFADKLSKTINKELGFDTSEVIPMDGFHLDNDTLDDLGLRHRKGAVNTFDAEGFAKMINELRSANGDVKIPLFDRNIDAVVPNAKTITSQQKILIVEGNYLLLNSDPWLKLHQLYDYKILLNNSLDTIKTRLINRWLNNGYELDSATQRALSNDIPNAEFVLENSVGADLIV